MNRTEAEAILFQYTEGDSLRRHARSVELVMRAYAVHFGEDPELWGNTGLLHDADYEKYPEQHPQVIVKLLREQGEEEMAHAIAAHYTKWNQPYNTKLDKVLLACDELTGFVIACTQVRPDGIYGLEAKSVIKKLKQKSFAAKVERDEVYAGVEKLGVELKPHIEFIITALRAHADELRIGT